MKNEERKYTRISIEDVQDKDTFIIENFIISDGDMEQHNILLNCPYIVEGIIFLICINGTGRIKINLREYSIQRNTIITIFPGFIVELLERSDDLLMEHLFFSFDFLSDLHVPTNSDIPSKIEEIPCITIPDEKAQTLLEYHYFIVKQYKQNSHIYRVEIAKKMLGAMLLEIASIYHNSRENESKATTRQEEVFNRFMRLLFMHVRKERSVAFYADKLFLSPKYLAQIIKNVSGRLALDWINEYTVLFMKVMLRSSQMTVAQISEELNFPNPSYFGQFFKKHTGKTPLKYRDEKE